MANYVQDYLYAELPRELIEKHVKWIVVPKIESVTPATENDLVTIAIVPNRGTKTYDMYITREVDGALTWYKLFQHPIPALPANTSAAAGEYVLKIHGSDASKNAWVRVEMPVGIEEVHINSEGDKGEYGHMIVYYDNGTKADAGSAIGPRGVSIADVEVDSEGKIHIIYDDGNSEVASGSLLGPRGSEGPRGASIDKAYVDSEGHLIVILTNSEEKDAGYVVGPQVKEAFISSEATSEYDKAQLVMILTDGSMVVAEGSTIGPQGEVGPQGSEGPMGVGVEFVHINSEDTSEGVEGDLIVYLTDGTHINAGMAYDPSLQRQIDALRINLNSEAQTRAENDDILADTIVALLEQHIEDTSELKALINSEARIRAAEDADIRAALKAGLDSEAAIREAEDLRLLALIDSERRRATGSEARLDAIKQDNLIASEGIVLNGAVISTKLDNDTLKFNSEGEIFVDLLATLPDGAGNEGKALILNSEGAVAWGEAGKVDGLDLIDGATTRVPIENKIIKLHLGDGLDFGSEGLEVDLGEVLPNMAGKNGKALTIDSEGNLSWGEAGKIDSIEVSDGTTTKVLPLANKQVTIRTDKGIGIATDGKIIHTNEIVAATIPATSIFIPKGVDAQGHITDGATGAANALREVRFLGKDSTSNTWVELESATISGQEVTKAALKVAGYNPSLVDKYRDATLKIDSNGLAVNLSGAEQKILATDTSEQFIIVNGNKLSLSPELLRRLELVDFKKNAIDSEGINDPRFYPTIQLLNEQLGLKQDELTADYPIVITSEDRLQLLYDTDTLALKPATSKLYVKDVNMAVWGKLTKLLTPQTSEGNKLVDMDYLNSAISGNLGAFRGNFDSEGELPTKAQVPDLAKNDYAFVTTEVLTSEGVQYFYNRYKFADTPAPGHWDFEYRVSGSTFTVNQLKAINSNWTNQLTDIAIDHFNDTVIHVTSEDKVRWDGKQDTLTASKGIAIVSKDIQHTNTITAQTTKEAYKVTLDAQGHVNGTPEVYHPDWEVEDQTKSDFIEHRPAIKRDTNSSSLTPDRNTGVILNDLTNNVASGNYSVAEGSHTTASGNSSHAEGYQTLTSEGADYSHAEGVATIASGIASHAEGGHFGSGTTPIKGNIASGVSSHAEGVQTKASGKAAHTEGYKTIASGMYSHAEGNSAQATGAVSHAEGNNTQSTGAGSHAEGTRTIASGLAAHAEGQTTEASGKGSHAEGYASYSGHSNIASGQASHAEGDGTTASGYAAHAEGGVMTSGGVQYFTVASGDSSHAEGGGTTASGPMSHAEGSGTVAANTASHAEGELTEARARESHAEGRLTVTNAESSHAEGRLTTVLVGAQAAHAEGLGTTAGGLASHAEGYQTTTSEGALYAHAEGEETLVLGRGAHAEGRYAVAEGDYSHAEGAGDDLVDYPVTAIGFAAHAEGYQSRAEGEASHAEGYSGAFGDGSHAEGASRAEGPISHAEGTDTRAEGDSSHTEGTETVASAFSSHAEGFQTIASGETSHVEGSNTTASGYASHAEGARSVASGNASHAEGAGQALGVLSHAEGGRYVEVAYSNGPIARGEASHAEGAGTEAIGAYSHAEGQSTIATGNNQHVQGQYNVRDTAENYADIVGWGASDGLRKNISSLTTSGDLHIKEDFYFQSDDDGQNGYKLPYTVITTTGTGAKTLALAKRDHIYIYPGPITSLTVTAIENTQAITDIIFTAGTSITVNLPTGVRTPEGFAGFAAGKTYEISILNNLAIVTTWA